MFEKVNPSHPDKLADRIAGAIVDLAYNKDENPKVAVEVLIGHCICHIIAETSVHFYYSEISKIVHRIGGPDMYLIYDEYEQDKHLAENQKAEIHCGDNGIFKGVPLTFEQTKLTSIARKIYYYCPTDGKYLIDGNDIIICQSNATEERLKSLCPSATKINPLGYWTGGTNADTGATNRKLGSDMYDSVTGGGSHGKDLSKADVSANIYCFLRAQELGEVVTACCAIGDLELTVYVGDKVKKVSFKKVVEEAKKYIEDLGGFESLAEWGLIY